MKNRKLAYMILHYGAPYLDAAMAAIYDQVDKIVILYTDQPSQGYSTSLPCPDTEAELMKECNPFWDRITWVNSRWGTEGDHVGAFRLFANDFDWAVRLDSDEIYPPGMVDEMIRQAETTGHKDYRIPFVHHWRSFAHGCRDAQMPTRLTRVHGGEGERYLDSGNGKWEVNHMGYAVPTRYIEYKLQVSGHHLEFRPDWLETRWKANALVDVHPVIFNWWTAEPYDVSQLPEVLKKHPNYGSECIDDA